MKRAGNLWGKLVEKENLRHAFYRAARGKWVRGRVREFSCDLEKNLRRLHADLESGSVVLGRYHSFEIRESKLRTIHAAHFEERVVHHALMAVIEPIFERAHVDHTYACRVGKGRLAALQHSRKCAASREWFLKGDVRKYFDSIPHEGVMGAVERKIKDRRVIELFQRILESYETSPGRGLPIGSLTSQHLANLYLAPLDRLVMEKCKLRYVRYMDDFVMWANEKETLKNARGMSGEMLDSLSLQWKAEPYLNRSRLGMDFLGMRVFPSQIRLSHTTKVRFCRNIRRLEQGGYTEEELQQRVCALLGNIRQADSDDWLRHMRRKGLWTRLENGQQPREPRGQLEQQREEHALC